MYDAVFPFVLGVFMAWITWFPARYLDAATERRFFTTIITIVALGFIGFPVQQGDLAALALEAALATILLILVLLSRKESLVLLLPIAWFLHGAWDLVFLLGLVPVDKPLWVVQLCVPYDWLLAGYLFRRVGVWQSD